MKTCISCRKELSIGYFYKHAAMADGHLSKCKNCCRRDSKENRRSKLEEKRAYDRSRNDWPNRVQARKRYAATPQGKVSSRAAKSRWVERNRYKKGAETAVGNAVRDGRLVRDTVCSRCGKVGKLEAHHHDYCKPLDVIWVHDPCHKAIHKEERAEIRRLRGIPF